MDGYCPLSNFKSVLPPTLLTHIFARTHTHTQSPSDTHSVYAVFVRSSCSQSYRLHNPLQTMSGEKERSNPQKHACQTHMVTPAAPLPISLSHLAFTHTHTHTSTLKIASCKSLIKGLSAVTVDCCFTFFSG